MTEELMLLRPLWLLALPAIAAATWWLVRRRPALGDWERAVAPELMAAMRALGRVDPGEGRGTGWLLPAAAALIVLSLAGPAVERRDRATFRNLDGVVLVIDASPSLTDSPAWSSTLATGQSAVASLGTRPAGIVVFAGDAYVATDMTAETRELGQTMTLIDAETVPDPGSRPERGLALARRMLDEARVVAGDVLLFTDGGGTDTAALREASAIATRGARLSVVAPDPGPVARALAEAGGGAVFDSRDANELSQWLEGSARAQLMAADYPLLYWSDRGRLLLVLAALPVLASFRRRSA